MTWKMTYTRPVALLKLERIEALLAERPRTALDLAEALPMSKRHVQGYLNHLMDEQRVHIKRWARTVEQSERMYPRPVYAVGKGKNAPPPPPLTPSQRQARAWARLKADDERYLNNLMKKRAQRLKPRSDVLATFLYGAAA